VLVGLDPLGSANDPIGRTLRWYGARHRRPSQRVAYANGANDGWRRATHKREPLRRPMTTIELDARFYKLAPPGEFAGLQQIELQVDLARAALLVVDVYGLGFTPEEGAARHHPSADAANPLPWEQIASDAIAPALDAARRVRMPVVYAHNSGPRIELNRSELGRTLNRTLDCDLEELFRESGVDSREYLTGDDNLFLETSEALGPKPGDYFIRKHQYSGFRDTRLDTLLRNLDVRTLFCVGFDAGTCLKMTMVDAFESARELAAGLLEAALLAFNHSPEAGQMD
jgi:nicotinamidase-related amidase